MLKLLVLCFGCLLPGQLMEAAFLQECEGFIVTHVQNPNQDCSEYIHCDGDNSYYCNGDCTEPVICYNTTVTATTSTTVITESTTMRPNAEPLSTEQHQPSTLSTSTSTSSPTIDSSNPSVICRNSNQNLVFPYPANKNYYYQCISRHLLLQQCPQNFYFNESEGKCIGTKPYRL